MGNMVAEEYGPPAELEEHWGQLTRRKLHIASETVASDAQTH